MADDNDIDISEETLGTQHTDNAFDIGNTSLHLNMSIDSNMETSILPDIEEPPIENVGVIDYGVIDVRDTKIGIIGGNTSMAGFSMVDLTIVKTESLADDQLPSSSHIKDEPLSLYENPDSTTGVDYTPRKVDSPANVSSTQEEDSCHGNRLVLGKRKFGETPVPGQEQKIIHDLGEAFDHVASASVLLYNMKVHLDRSKRFCAPCGTLFPSRAVAKIHNSTQHKQCEQPLQLQFNSQIFNTDKDLADHMSCHEKKTSLKCTACHRTFYSNEDLIQHVYNFHFNIDKFSCKKCKAKFTKESNLRQHELACKTNVFLNKPLIVGKSSPSFTVPKSVPVKPAIPDSSIKYMCKICKEVVRGKTERKKHRLKHPEVKRNCTLYISVSMPMKNIMKPSQSTGKLLKPMHSTGNLIKTLGNPSQSLKAQYTKKPEKDNLIPMNVLFFCPKCDCAFSKWKSAENHLDVCKGFTVDKKECGRCKVFVAEWVTHLKQHSLGNDFEFIQLTSKNISELLLFECPLCFVCFDDTIIMHHFNKCNVKQIQMTKYYCDVCNVSLPINYMKFHNMAHDKNDKFIVIRHGVINDAKLTKLKIPIIMTSRFSNSDEMKILADMKQDKDDRIKLTKCKYCCHHQHVDNIKALLPLHLTGKCRLSTNLTRNGVVCKLCGLKFSPASMQTHVRLHSKQDLTLRNFVIYDMHTGNKIAPVSAETVKCNTCGISFYARRQYRLHKCHITPNLPCDHCDKKFTDTDIDIHMNFHLYAQEFDVNYESSLQVEEKKRNKKKYTYNDKLVKCPLCLNHVSNFNRHLKICKRGLGTRKSKFCDICKVNIHIGGYYRHMLHRHSIKIQSTKNDKNKNRCQEKIISNENKVRKVMPAKPEMHRVYKCKICHIAYLTVAERNVHASKVCKMYDYESCISCDLIFDNHKKHVNVHKNYPSFVKDNIRIIEFGKEKIKYVVRQCQNCTSCLMTNGFDKHKSYCRGRPTSKLQKCKLCNLNFNVRMIDKHLKYHKMNKDFIPSNIRIILCGEDKNDDSFAEQETTSAVKRKLNENDQNKVSDESFKRRKIKREQKIESEDSDSEDYLNNPRPSTSKRRSVAIEDPIKHDSNLPIKYDQVLTKTTKKYAVFQCDDCLSCFLHNKNCENHLKECTKLKKANPCDICGLIFKKSDHGHNRPDFVRENITVIPVFMSKFTVFRCVRCQLCCLTAVRYHAQVCLVKGHEKSLECDLCFLRFPVRSFQKHQLYCGYQNTMYVIDFDPFDDGSKSNNDTFETSSSVALKNTSYVTELDQTDLNDSTMDTTHESSFKTQNIDVVKYYRCKGCQMTFIQIKRIHTHVCVFDKTGNPRGSKRCDVCNLFFVHCFINSHMNMHNSSPEQYAIENVIVTDFDPIAKQSSEVRNAVNDNIDSDPIAKQLSDVKDSVAEDHDSADEFDDPNNSYDQNSKTDQVLSEETESNDTGVQKLYQCKHCEMCMKNIYNAKRHAMTFLNQKACIYGRAVCNICNLSFRKTIMKNHMADHKKFGSINYDITTFDESLAQEPFNVWVYKCVCSLEFVEFIVFCNHVGNCNKQSKAGKYCDVCNLNLNENQYLTHKKYHNTSMKYTFDVIEFKEDEVPVVKRLYKCKVCHCHFTIKLAALKHIEHCENNSDSKICSCGIKFHAASITSHKNQYQTRLHGKDEFEIELVEKTAPDKKQVDHKIKIFKSLGKYKIYRCTSCKTSYLNYKKCYNHVATKDCALNPLDCELCFNTFIPSDMVQHKKDHEQLNLTFHDIQIVAMRPSSGVCIGIRREETNYIYTIYQCTHCNVNFVSEEACKTHLHNETESNEMEASEKRLCKFCRLIFYDHTICLHLSMHHKDEIKVEQDIFNVIRVDPIPAPSANESTKSAELDEIRRPKIDLFRCVRCDIHFLTSQACDQHIFANHLLKEIKNCLYCGLKFRKITAHKHTQLHHPEGKYKRPDYFNIIDIHFCEPKKSIRPITIKQEINVTDSPSFSCIESVKNTPATTIESYTSIVEEEFNVSNTLTESIINEDQIIKKDTCDPKDLILFRCTDCGVCYSSEYSISQHYDRKDKRKVLNPVICEFCGYSFGRVSYKTHKELHHPDVQKIDPKLFKIIDYPYNSEEMILRNTKSTSRKSSNPVLKKKVETKNIGKIKYLRCKDCNVCFLNDRQFKRHTSNHEKLPDYIFLECKICHFNFQIVDLPEHMKHHEIYGLELTDICVEELCIVTGETTIYLGNNKYEEAEKQDQNDSINKAITDDNTVLTSVITDKDTATIAPTESLNDTADISQSEKTNTAEDTQELVSCNIKQSTEDTLEDYCMETSHINDSAMNADDNNLTKKIYLEIHDCKNISNATKEINDDRINLDMSNSKITVDYDDGKSVTTFVDSQIINQSKHTNNDSKELVSCNANTDLGNSDQITHDDDSENVPNVNNGGDSVQSKNNIDDLLDTAGNTHSFKTTVVEDNLENIGTKMDQNIEEADSKISNTTQDTVVTQIKPLRNDNDENIHSVPCADNFDFNTTTIIEKDNDNTIDQDTTESNIGPCSMDVDVNKSTDKNTIAETITATDSIANKSDNTMEIVPNLEINTYSESSAIDTNDNQDNIAKNNCRLREKILFEDE